MCTLEQEFKRYSDLYKASVLIAKITQYYKDLNQVDIPEFCKLPEDKIVHKADMEVCRVIIEGRLDELYQKAIT